MKTKLALTLAFLLASGLLLSGHVVAQDGSKDKAEYNADVVKGVRAVLSTRKQKELPISRTRSSGRRLSISVISATMYGCEIV